MRGPASGRGWSRPSSDVCYTAGRRPIAGSVITRHTVWALIVALVFAGSAAVVTAQQQLLQAGPNVNLAGGPAGIDVGPPFEIIGDPYMQRQNEPSMACSSRNPLTCLAAANDYRTIDIPGLPDDRVTGDAWIGIFWTRDGGRSWRSTLLPGFPQDTSEEGLSSEINGWLAAADPTVRAGTNGLFYVSGIAFNRDDPSPFVAGGGSNSAAFVSTYIDDNNTQDATTPLRHVRTVILAEGTPTTFIDKPWVVADIPRGNTFCRIPGVAPPAPPPPPPAGQAVVCHRPLGNTANVRNLTVGEPAVEAHLAHGDTLGACPVGGGAVANGPGPDPTAGMQSVARKQASSKSDGSKSGSKSDGSKSDGSKSGSKSKSKSGGGGDPPDPPQPPVGIPDQTIPAGAVHMVYTVFEGEGDDITSRLVYRRSADCGESWDNELELNRGAGINQSANVQVDPTSGAIYVAWREFASEQQVGRQTVQRPSRLLMVRSRDGRRFNRPVTVVDFGPSDPFAGSFDQTTLPNATVPDFRMFRTNAYPALCVDGNGLLRLAWSQRGLGPLGTSRIVMATSPDGRTWSAPQPVDDHPLPGHQLMPEMICPGTTATLIWYDSRRDAAQVFGNDAFGPAIADAIPPPPAHTLDVFGAQTGENGLFGPSIPISRYVFAGPVGDDPAQAQFHSPNWPLYAGGTAPFMGDFIALTAAKGFTPPTDGNGWQFATASSLNTEAHAAWTDNRDVIPPEFGDWTNWGPVGTNACVPGSARSRNQNIYTARLTSGLMVDTLGNSRPLSPEIERGFALFVQNSTGGSRADPEDGQPRRFRLLASQPPGGRASFQQSFPGATPTPLLDSVDAYIQPRSSIARTLFVTSTDSTASVTVLVFEIDDQGNPVPGGLQGTTVINPDPTTPPPTDPEVFAFDEQYGGELSLAETRDYPNPTFLNPTFLNADVYDSANPTFLNPTFLNAILENTDAYDSLNPTFLNPTFLNEALAALFEATHDNPTFLNPTFLNPTFLNASAQDEALRDQPEITDVTWTVTNNGNVPAAFNFNALVTAEQQGVIIQLIIYKIFFTPTSVGCDLDAELNGDLLVNIVNPTFLNEAQNPTFLNPTFLNTILSGDASNATFALGPNQFALVTYRVAHTGDFAPEDIEGTISSQAVDPLSPEAETGEANTDAINDLALALADTPDPVLVGDPVRYTATVTNNGLFWATNVSLTQILPAGVPLDAVTPSQGSCLEAGGVVTCVLGLMENGALATVDIDLTPSVAGTIATSAAVTGNDTDPDEANNVASVTTDVVTDAPAGLAFLTQPPNAILGQTFDSPVEVAIVNGVGQTIPLSGVQVDLVLEVPGGAVLNGGSETTVNGVATFSAVTVSGEANLYNLIASAPALPALRSDPFVVTEACLVSGPRPRVIINVEGPGIDSFPIAAVEADDLNGDGLPDMVVLHEAGGLVTWMEGNGFGDYDIRFQTGLGGAGPVGLAVGDLDGDLLDDVVVAYGGSQQLAVALSDGNFFIQNVPPAPIPASPAIPNGGGTPSDIAIGQLNPGTDGFMDVVVTYGDSTVVGVFHGDGAGNLAPPVYVDAGAAQGAIAIGDLNKDGGLDLVVANDAVNDVTVILMSPDQTTFAAPLAFAVGNPVDLALGDLDADTNLDVVVANNAGRSVEVLLGDGAGSLALSQTVDFVFNGSNPVSVTVGDWDRDGDLDAATASPGFSHLGLLFNDGGGQLSAPQFGVNHPEPVFVTTADPQQDGFPEIVLVNRQHVAGGRDHFVLFLNSCGELTADVLVQVADDVDPVEVLTDVTYTAEVFNKGPFAATAITLTVSANLSPAVNPDVTPSQGSCNGNGPVICDLGALAPGASATVIAVVTAPPQATIRVTASVTATEFDLDPPDNTDSEITLVDSRPFSFVVTNTNDTGQGSLREAIANAERNVGHADTIVFDIPGNGPHTIQPLSPLPTLTDPVVVDGTTQPGFAGTPVIEIDGSLAGVGANGLYFIAGGNTVRGLVVNRFDRSGLRFDGPGGNLIEGNFIGTDLPGTAALGNGRHGLEVRSPNNTIGGVTAAARNIVSGNVQRGVHISASLVAEACVPATPCIDVSGNVVIGNYVGTDVTGTQPLGNALSGVLLFQAIGGQIGGAAPGEGNVVSGNRNGVTISGGTASGNVVVGNRIGTDAAGTGAVPNDNIGVLITGSINVGRAHDNVVGGAGAGEGNVISGNLSSGVSVGGHDNQVLGNLVGTDVTGTVAVGNKHGVALWSGPNNVVGGAAANVVSGNTVNGVTIVSLFSTADAAFTDASGNTVAGNKIGTNLAGTLAVPNGTEGVYVDGGLDQGDGDGPADVPVVGTVISGNTIAGNTLWGIRLKSLVTGTEIVSNSIGSGSGGVPLGNGLDGVRVDGPGVNDTTIGGQLLFERNTIAHNAGNGILIFDGTGHAILPNAIFDNGSLGIDFNEDGVTPNDPLDADIGPNNLQNFPVLGPAVKDGGTTTFGGSLHSTPNTAFVVRIFGSDVCDPSGNGEGATPLASAALATDGAGDTAVFGGDIFVDLPIGSVLTATATDPDGNTSEFSACVDVTEPPQTFTVTNTNDVGAGSLRDAIEQANANVALDTIDFAIPGAGPHTIQPSSPLPIVTDRVAIDGRSQTGFVGAPLIELDGSLAGVDVDGLSFTAPGGVRSLVINRFGGSGIVLDGSGGSQLEGNYIGVDVTGTQDRGNGRHGVEVRSPNNTIGGPAPGTRNVISGNTFDGIRLAGVVSATRIQGNVIGTDVAGTGQLGNGGAGIALEDPGVDDTLIGGAAPADGNTISGNGGWGVSLQSTTDARLLNNTVGLGTDAGILGNGLGGIRVDSSASAVVGAPLAGNVISGNTGGGVVISGSVVPAAVLQGNRIGTDPTGTAARPNTALGVHIEHASTDNVVGGILGGQGNLISGNGNTGLLIRGDGTLVEGNKIGTDITGLVALPNTGGVHIEFGQFNTVGGPTAAHRNVLSGNTGTGVFLGGNLPFLPTPTTGNRVEGNYIGVDATGAAPLPNGEGMNIRESANLTVVTGNVISGNTVAGVSLIEGAANNTVENNRIGTDASGTVALGNGDAGVVIAEATNTTVGGNVISGNGSVGVAIVEAATAGTVVTGNHIGTDLSGTMALGNTGNGIVIQNAPDTVIGGSMPADRNIISANGSYGVEIQGATAIGNSVHGNFVGTDVSGTLAIGNGAGGVNVSGAINTTLGGPGTGNVISGNTFGVVIGGATTTGTVLEGNRIGTDLNGTAALGNTSVGVLIQDAPNTIIGGPTAAERNIISANGSHGIEIQGVTATGNVVQGNYIGTDVGGTVDLGNARDGVVILGAANNTVGGPVAGQRNVISGNDEYAVRISGAAATGNVLRGNYLGTDATGANALANVRDGVGLFGNASLTTVADNVISGNARHGVLVSDAANNAVENNLIGTDASGAVALGNGSFGVALTLAANNTVSGNTIADSGLTGINISGAAATGNVVSGNRIGTDLAGVVALGNTFDGIQISAPNNVIGGPAPADRNLISANGAIGVHISGADANGNLVQGNFIGTDGSGVIDLGNGSSGVQIDGASGNSVGGAGAGEPNTVAFNQAAGIVVAGATAVDNAVRANEIHDNGGLGIDLGGDGVTDNDAGVPPDADVGPNDLQNFPTFNFAGSNATETVVSGVLINAGVTQYTIEFFSIASCDPSGNGEGETFIGSTIIDTDPAGPFFETLPVQPIGHFITATATDLAGNTSEFSACEEVQPIV